MAAPTIPSEATAYKRTRVFDERSVPRSLLTTHRTVRGVWARIRVLDGRIRYCSLEGDHDSVILDEHRDGIVEPEVSHRLELMGPVRFYLEFCRAPVSR